MDAEFKILCVSQACDEVKGILKGKGFTKIKDLNNSPSFDISAKNEFKDREQLERVAKEILEESGNVVSIQVNT